MRDCTEKLDENKISRNVSELDHLIRNMNVNVNTVFEANHSCMKSSSPVGCLKRNIGQWRLIGANSFILEVIEKGYKLPLFTAHESVELKTNKSAIENVEFVSKEVDCLLKKGCISEVSCKPKVVNSLTVAGNKASKLRLVLDARHVNPHLFKYKHQYEDAKVAKCMFTAEDYIFSFDLKSAYHHIEIHELSREYLGFKWQDRYYVFNVLPFGISTAGYIFTKVMREIVKFWRSKGIRIVMYLDDGIGGGFSLREVERISSEIH